MRFSVVVFFTASLASAYTVLKRQDDIPIPECGKTCLASAPPDPCDRTDIACLCLNPNYLSAVTTCGQSSCSAQDLEAAAAGALALCKAAGVDILNPIPACAIPCAKAQPTDTCAAEDVACLCKDTTYIQSVYTCLQSSCTGDDLKNAEIVGRAGCSAVGVDISSTVGAV